MKKMVEENSAVLVDNSPSLPLNYGEIQAKKHMKEFKDKVINSFNEPELRPEFIEEMRNTEKEESILVENLDDLFK